MTDKLAQYRLTEYTGTHRVHRSDPKAIGFTDTSARIRYKWMSIPSDRLNLALWSLANQLPDLYEMTLEIRGESNLNELAESLEYRTARKITISPAVSEQEPDNLIFGERMPEMDFLLVFARNESTKVIDTLLPMNNVRGMESFEGVVIRVIKMTSYGASKLELRIGELLSSQKMDAAMEGHSLAFTFRTLRRNNEY